MSTPTEETASGCIQENMATAAKLHICNLRKLCRTSHYTEGFTINSQTTVQRVSLSTHKPLYREFHYQLKATVQVLLSTHQPLYKGFSLSDHKPLYRAFHYQLTSSYTERFTINSKANVQSVSLSTQKPVYRVFHYQLKSHCTEGFTIN